MTRLITHTTTGQGERIALAHPLVAYWSTTLQRWVTIPGADSE